MLHIVSIVIFETFFSNLYYRLVRLFALSDMPKGGFDYVLIDRAVVNFIKTVKEKLPDYFKIIEARTYGISKIIFGKFLS